MAKNVVIAGDYLGYSVKYGTFTEIVEIYGYNGYIHIDKKNVDSYELVTDEHRKSAASGITRGLIGAAFLGPVGLLAGISAKSKGTYQIMVQFKNGKKCLIEVDDKIYKGIIKNCF